MRKEIVTCDRSGHEMPEGNRRRNVRLSLTYEDDEGTIRTAAECVMPDACDACYGAAYNVVEKFAGAFQKKGGKE